MRARTPILTLAAVLGLGILSKPSSLQTLSETFGGRIQRFTPKAGADRNLLVGVPQPLMPKSAGN